jgi:cysteine desulfurase
VADPVRTYLDATSSEPLRVVAREALLTALADGWADPTRLHSEARKARLLWDEARESVAAGLRCRPDEISFPASGTAAVGSGLAGLLLGRRRAGDLLVHSAVEHSAVLRAAQEHARAGGRCRVVAIDRVGVVQLDDLAAAVGEEGVGVVALQWAGLESGAIQPVEAVAQLCRDHGVPWFADLSAGVGRLRVPDGWAVATASAHKWGGPAGVGVLAIRKASRWRDPAPRDDRIDPRVAGFENVPAVLAAAAALRELAAQEGLAERQQSLTERLREEVPRLVPDCEVVGPAQPRLPHVFSCSFLYVDGEALVHELDRAGLAVASGSACTASTLEPSHVLAAMGVLTHGNIRIGLSADASEDDVDRLLAVLPGVVASLRARVDAPR